jgi:phosphate-selective porin
VKKKKQTLRVSHALKGYTSLQQYGGTWCTSAKTATTEIATEMGAEPKFKASFTKIKIKGKKLDSKNCD